MVWKLQGEMKFLPSRWDMISIPNHSAICSMWHAGSMPHTTHPKGDKTEGGKE